ncbi:MAG: SRPBCC domain-containing protein [Planctomycetes bacterium]|nr:SRPBCC domain-containing protein [Planctomycetota bacterium]
MTAKTKDREIVSTRVFNATREQILDAYRDPQLFARWLGPKGFSNEFHHFDFRAGGTMKITMIGPKGEKYPNEWRFNEISPGRLVFDHLGTAHHFTMTITLEEKAGKTAMTWVQLHDTPEQREAMMKFVPQANEENFDRLESILKEAQTAAKTVPVIAQGQELTVSRTFNAPRKMVWRTLAEAEHMAQWWGPGNLRTLKFDFRPGGSFLFAMDALPVKAWGRLAYREISPQDRIVWISSFCDEKGAAIPCVPGWPLESIDTVTLEESGGKTTLTLRAVAINCTEEERKAFEAAFGDITQGLNDTFDQLQQYLPKLARLS